MICLISAGAGLPPVRDLVTAHLTTAIEIGHDARLLIIGLMLAIGSFLGFGCAPAWITSRMPLRMHVVNRRRKDPICH